MDQEQHIELYKEFVHYERMTGGPDHHIAVVVDICKDLEPMEQLWRVYLYVGFYTVPSAEAIWRKYSYQQFLDCDKKEFQAWLQHNWEHGFAVRNERRTTNTPPKYMSYLSDFERTAKMVLQMKDWDFDHVWEFALGIKHIGRYFATKLVECWYRLGFTSMRAPDIRAKKGWSPRKGLQLMYADQMLYDPREDTDEAVSEAERFAARLQREHVPHLNTFNLEVTLCNYKASILTFAQYPGKSLDTELKFEHQIQPYWYIKKGTTANAITRKKLFPEWALGEFAGWRGPREGCLYALADFGYTWTDSLYDYNATTDFEFPVRK